MNACTYLCMYIFIFYLFNNLSIILVFSYLYIYSIFYYYLFIYFFLCIYLVIYLTFSTVMGLLAKKIFIFWSKTRVCRSAPDLRPHHLLLRWRRGVLLPLDGSSALRPGLCGSLSCERISSSPPFAQTSSMCIHRGGS